MFKNDYLMRQVEALSETVAHLVFRKQSADYVPTNQETPADALYFNLHQLVEQGKIAQAEDALYEACDLNDPTCLEVAVDFYAHLNNLTDQELEAGDFSREEIQEGLKDLLDQFGITLF